MRLLMKFKIPIKSLGYEVAGAVGEQVDFDAGKSETTQYSISVDQKIRNGIGRKLYDNNLMFIDILVEDFFDIQCEGGWA